MKKGINKWMLDLLFSFWPCHNHVETLRKTNCCSDCRKPHAWQHMRPNQSKCKSQFRVSGSNMFGIHHGPHLCMGWASQGKCLHQARDKKPLGDTTWDTSGYTVGGLSWRDPPCLPNGLAAIALSERRLWMQQDTFKGTGPEHPKGSEGHRSEIHAGVCSAQSTQQNFQC